MWNGKNKAVTFSFDDGVLQDKKLLKLFNELGLKATFNINSSRFGFECPYERNGVQYERTVINVEELKDLYSGHEIASHTLTHTNLTTLNDSSIIWQVEQDRKVLSDLVGYEVKGLAYPCGGVNNDDRVADVIKNNTKIKYCRTIISTYNYDLQTNLYRFNPTVFWCENCLYDIVDTFIGLKTDKPQLLYVWGHTYEFNDKVDFDKFATMCKKLASQKDIFFGTNSEVLLKNN